MLVAGALLLITPNWWSELAGAALAVGAIALARMRAGAALNVS
jgi:hypothetical protein